MTDYDETDYGTDEYGVPLRYSAEWHYGGCLPDTEVLLWATAAEAWADLITRLFESDIMWEEAPANSPMHPNGVNLDKSTFHMNLELAVILDIPGVLAGPDGYLYTVEDTHVMTCGDPTCCRTFPDLYPAGRCPYENIHGVAAFRREVGAR